MKEDSLPSSGDTEAANPYPPFSAYKWEPPSKVEKFLANGVTITIRLLPTAIMVWIFAPDQVKYMAKNYVRYIPYGIRYLKWWLNQVDF